MLVPGAVVIQRRRGSQTRDKAEDEGPPAFLLLTECVPLPKLGEEGPGTRVKGVSLRGIALVGQGWMKNHMHSVGVRGGGQDCAPPPPPILRMRRWRPRDRREVACLLAEELGRQGWGEDSEALGCGPGPTTQDRPPAPRWLSRTRGAWHPPFWVPPFPSLLLTCPAAPTFGRPGPREGFRLSFLSLSLLHFLSPPISSVSLRQPLLQRGLTLARFPSSVPCFHPTPDAPRCPSPPEPRSPALRASPGPRRASPCRRRRSAPCGRRRGLGGARKGQEETRLARHARPESHA